MSARTVITYASAMTLSWALAACTGQEQSLGNGPSVAARDPRGAPTTWEIEPDAVCPWLKPAEGSPCATLDPAGAPSAPQCQYDRATSCPSVCVCGYGGLWTCFATACGILSADRCIEGASCGDGIGCASETHVCQCRPDQTLSCVDMATVELLSGAAPRSDPGRIP